MKNAAPRRLALLLLAGSAAVFGLLGAAALAPALAQVSPEVQQACTPDVMRLCNEFVPDVAKITACMNRKRAQVSATCSAAIHPPRVRRVARRSQHHH
jgi:hypothetical protein